MCGLVRASLLYDNNGQANSCMLAALVPLVSFFTASICLLAPRKGIPASLARGISRRWVFSGLGSTVAFLS